MYAFRIVVRSFGWHDDKEFVVLREEKDWYPDNDDALIEKALKDKVTAFGKATKDMIIVHSVELLGRVLKDF